MGRSTLAGPTPELLEQLPLHAALGVETDTADEVQQVEQSTGELAGAPGVASAPLAGPATGTAGVGARSPVANIY